MEWNVSTHNSFTSLIFFFFYLSLSLFFFFSHTHTLTLTLTLTQQGKYIGSIDSAFVARYLFEAYVDEQSPTPSTRSSVRQGFLRAFGLV